MRYGFISEIFLMAELLLRSHGEYIRLKKKRINILHANKLSVIIKGQDNESRRQRYGEKHINGKDSPGGNILRQRLFDRIKKKYKVEPDHPWRRDPESTVFRHADNGKWFALVMNVQGEKLGMPEKDHADIVNLKVDDPVFRDILIRQAGIIPAYHMNKQNWITVLLDGTVPEGQVYDLLEMSFLATATAKKKTTIREPKE